jgi:hypothetical protein
MPDSGLLSLLERMKERSGASLAACKQALRISNDDPRAALNLLASQGHTGSRPSYDEDAPPGCYAMDSYAEALAAACVAALLPNLLQTDEPVGTVVLYAPAGPPAASVAVRSQSPGRPRDRIMVGVGTDAGSIPTSFGDDDPLLQTFRYRFGFQQTRPDVGPFDEDLSIGWEEEQLPTCLFVYEMVQCAQAVATAIAGAGIPVVPGCLGGYARHDSFASSRENQLAVIKSELREHLTEVEALQAFSRLCYATAEKQSWLVDLPLSTG